MALHETRTVQTKSGDSIILRPALVTEAASVLNAFKEILPTSPYILSTVESAATKTVETQVKWITAANEDPRSALIIAEHEGRIVGITNMAAFKDSKRSHRAGLGMSVHHDYRGQGLGEALLRRLIEVAQSLEGLRFLELNVMSANKAAHRLYLKLGFKQIGYQELAYRQPDGTFTDDICMCLDLTARP
ncbi:N-acetyltransferase family protein [Bdellovibrio bacteriovorus]|uniref:GNAT family N-acetyltransferase n=1 Tax=Bdellovibrio bacteriovorus TaxID=959 RepID=UPI0035A632CD